MCARACVVNAFSTSSCTNGFSLCDIAMHAYVCAGSGVHQSPRTSSIYNHLWL